ncbi:hypothetical protein RvY_07309-4 [Ramazzottius varieornatus]|uniref:Uncharacterized protein n=1 Tax=Ramazzottius varieornatus TaxID=947166 RepID=A0A1D1V497_RAMVA|nr:hypothetical protein RvY_07309-4 [Ramazzottius varieornatus]
MPTRDQYWEYYDALQFLTVFCTTGYIMTGIAKKPNPRTSGVTTPFAPGLVLSQYNVDWIQCCRVGTGPPVAVAPPLAQGSYGETSGYVARTTRSNPEVPPDYRHQYHRESRNECDQSVPVDNASLPNLPHCSAHYATPSPIFLGARRR